MKTYVHARLGPEDRAILQELKKSTGDSESELVRRGLRLAQQDFGRRRTALEVAGSSVGKFKGGPKDLATHPRHLKGFGT